MKNMKSSYWDTPKVCVAQESLSDQNEKELPLRESREVWSNSSAGVISWFPVVREEGPSGDRVHSVASNP